MHSPFQSFLPTACRVLALLCLALAGLGTVDAETAAGPEHPHVLILYSTGRGARGIALFDEGLYPTLISRGALEANDLFAEYLDLERNRSDPDYRTQLLAFLKAKYANQRVDAILTVQRPALEWLLQDSGDLFGNAPVATVQTARPEGGEGDRHRIVSHLANPDIGGTLKAALGLFPDTRKVLVVAGDTESDRAFAQSALAQVKSLNPQLLAESTSGLSLASTLQRCAQLPTHSIVLFTQFSRDALGKSSLSYEIERQVVATAQAPVFGLFDINLTDGGIGGSVISIKQLGVRSAQTLLDIARGRVSLDQPMAEVDLAPVPMFDWQQIRRWGGNVSALPPGAVLLNHAPSVLEQYGGYIAGLATFVAAQFALIAALLIVRQRQRAMKRSLQASEERYRVLIEQAPDAILVYDQQLDRYVDCNATAVALFKCTRAELLQMGPQDILSAGQFEHASVQDVVTATVEGARRGDPQVAERRLRDRQGREMVCEARYAIIPDPERTLLRISLIDIAERKQADTALRIAATAFDTQLGIVITDAAKAIQQVNQAFTAITGYASHEVIGQSPHMWASGRHDKRFFTELWTSVRSQGAWQGEIWNRRKDGSEYPASLTISAVKDDEGEVTHYVATYSDITASKAAEKEIADLAFNDPLTRLPNRRMLMDRLAKVLASGTRHRWSAAILFIDLDNFKTLNDSLGHAGGDQLLVQVAQRLLGGVRDEDTVARLGGDEFVVVLEALSEEALAAAAQAKTVGNSLLKALREPYTLGGKPYHGSASIGITLLTEDSTNLDDILRQADLAMYHAKADGRNTLRFFDPQMQAAVSARAALEADLRVAIDKQQFVLHYQAQVHGERVIGAEALVRWQHPLRGLVAPAEFIPLAEESGLILPLGQWVLRSACEQLAQWAGSAALSDVVLAVNVSVRQFHQENFVDQVRIALADSGANPRRLKLELTESMLLHNMDEVAQKMYALKALGLGFSLDDLGTGYSSLAYLKRLPLDQLKIDQGFVRDILHDANDAAIANMVIVLAHSLGLSVIAEGVETVAQRDLLAAQGCHNYQGYLFSRPVPAAEFERLVQPD